MTDAEAATISGTAPAARAPAAAGALLRPADRAYGGETYYGRPVVKPSTYGWRVASYMFIGGMSGAAQIIATLCDLAGPAGMRPVVRRGRYLALAGTTVGGGLLIADLHTPQRFFNMLRIFRKTSPMSIGTYVLMSFGGFSAATALGQVLEDRGGGPRARRLARAAQVPAALSGAGMATYTAALLASTATPLWAAAPCLLATRFGSSAMASGAAVLALGERRDGRVENAEALEGVAMAAAATELAASIAADLRYDELGVAGPLHRPPWGPIHAVGEQALGLAAPLALYALARRKPPAAGRLAMLASLGILAGSLLMRAGVLKAGNESAKRPRDYFHLAQPGRIPENRGRTGDRPVMAEERWR